MQLDDGFDFGLVPDGNNSRKTIRQVEQEMIEKALEEAGWKIEGQYGAATRLGMAPSTLRERIKKYRLRRSRAAEGISLFSG